MIQWTVCGQSQWTELINYNNYLGIVEICWENENKAEKDTSVGCHEEGRKGGWGKLGHGLQGLDNAIMSCLEKTYKHKKISILKYKFY